MGVRFFTKYLLLPFFGRVYYRNNGKEIPIDNYRKEVSFISQSILYSVLRGSIVGIAAGLVVVVFRLAIEKLFGVFSHLYPLATDNPIYLLLIGGLYLVIALLVGHLIKYEPNAKGSGIPQVEAELKGMMDLSWWSVLWKKFIGGVLSIASGLMLGREGPSILLGALTAKGVSVLLKSSEMERRSLIASGAAAGLAAAFNAPNSWSFIYCRGSLSSVFAAGLGLSLSC